VSDAPVRINVDVSPASLNNLPDELIELLPVTIAQAMGDALNFMGQSAVSRHMIMTGGAQASRWTPINASMLTIRTGRLARSLMGQIQGSKSSVMNEGRHTISQSGNLFQGEIATSVPYARSHEFGGDFRITERQTKFFYAMWKTRGDTSTEARDMWFALFLKGKMRKTIRRPARPFMRPMIADPITHDGVNRIFKLRIQNLMKGVARN
jgi:hypothetical protein